MFLEQNFIGNKNLQKKVQNYELFSCKMVIFNMCLKKNKRISTILYIISNTPHFMFKNASMKPWSNVVGLSCAVLSHQSLKSASARLYFIITLSYTAARAALQQVASSIIAAFSQKWGLGKLNQTDC